MLTETQKQIIKAATDFFNGWCSAGDPNMKEAILDLTNSSLNDEDILLQELQWIADRSPEHVISVGDSFTRTVIRGCLNGIGARLMIEEEWVKGKTLEEVENEYEKLFQILDK